MDGEENKSSPILLSELIFDTLDKALDYGISESQFWEMTLAEVQRAVKSKIRVNKIEARERATFDYIQASLIIKGISMILSDDKGNFPTIQEVYSDLFDDVIQEQETKAQEKIATLSVLRFKQYANFHNKKFKKEVAEVNE